jgi:ribonuclease P protein component
MAKNRKNNRKKNSTKKFITLKRNSEFKRVYGESGKSNASCRHTAVRLAANGLTENRFGITVSRKVGKACVRNKVRRRIREILRAFFFSGEGCGERFCERFCTEDAVNYDIVVVARQNAAEATFTELKSGLERTLERLLYKTLAK